MSGKKDTPAPKKTTATARTVAHVGSKKPSPKKALPEIPSPVYRIVRQSEGDQGIDEGCDQEQSGYQESKLR